MQSNATEGHCRIIARGQAGASDAYWELKIAVKLGTATSVKLMKPGKPLPQRRLKGVDTTKAILLSLFLLSFLPLFAPGAQADNWERYWQDETGSYYYDTHSVGQSVGINVRLLRIKQSLSQAVINSLPPDFKASYQFEIMALDCYDKAYSEMKRAFYSSTFDKIGDVDEITFNKEGEAIKILMQRIKPVSHVFVLFQLVCSQRWWITPADGGRASIEVGVWDTPTGRDWKPVAYNDDGTYYYDIFTKLWPATAGDHGHVLQVATKFEFTKKGIESLPSYLGKANIVTEVIDIDCDMPTYNPGTWIFYTRKHSDYSPIFIVPHFVANSSVEINKQGFPILAERVCKYLRN